MFIPVKLTKQANSIHMAELKGLIHDIEKSAQKLDFKAASEMINRIENLKQTEATLLTLATYRCREGKWGEAKAVFESISSTFPSSVYDIKFNSAYRQAVFNHDGIISGHKFLGTLSHSQALERNSRNSLEGHKSTDKKMVFISGMPRSGTSALGRLINNLDGIHLEVEMYNPYLNYSQSSFSEKAIDLVSKKKGRKYFDGITLQSLAAVGDKRPLFHYSLPGSLDLIGKENLYVLHLSRSLQSIVDSYVKRSLNTNDLQWDRFRGQSVCLDEIKVMLEFSLEWEKANSGCCLKYVDYHRIFCDFDYCLQQLESLSHFCRGRDLSAREKSAIKNFQCISQQHILKARSKVADKEEILDHVGPSLVSRFEREFKLSIDLADR